MKLFAALFCIIVFGIVAGGALSYHSLQENRGFGALRIGAWTAWPLAGDPEADPYTKAKIAAEGDVPLGAAEGLLFHAQRDDAGAQLRRECHYMLEGTTPTARFWTLSSRTVEGDFILTENAAIRTLSSRSLVRNANGAFTIAVGPDAMAGNWFQTDGTGPYQLVMHLYDTPVTGTRGIVDPQMPGIRLVECAS